MHDVGHFPFSHTAEDVLSDFVSAASEKPERGPMRSIFEKLAKLPPDQPLSHLHEHIGRELTHYIYTNFGDEPRDFGLLCFSVAEEIASPESGHPLAKSLHSLISGNLDADRCDYVRRDGFASAFEFGDFDLDRILHTLRFCKPEAGSSEDFIIVPTTVALSALESFFLERYRIWRWLVFHHTAIALDLALTRALTILLEIACDGPFEIKDPGSKEVLGKIKNVLVENKFEHLWLSFKEQKSYRLFVACDESWLLTVLRRVQTTISEVKEGDLKLVALCAYLDLVLDRRKRLKPLWKRQEDYADFCKYVVQCLPPSQGKEENPVVQFNKEVLTRLPGPEESNKVTRMREFEKSVQDKLEGFEKTDVGVLAKRLAFKPWNPEKPTKVLDLDTNKLIPLEDLSIIVRNLPRMWSEDMQLRMYRWFRKPTGSEKDKFKLLEGGDPPSLEQLATAFAKALPQGASRHREDGA